MKEGAGFCDYRLLQEGGTPICARYVHGPMYEIDEDTGKAIDASFPPIPYVEDSKIHKVNENDEPLYWDNTASPPVETTTDTGDPVMVKTSREWLTNDFVDTHEKRFRIQDHTLGWYHDV